MSHRPDFPSPLQCLVKPVLSSSLTHPDEKDGSGVRERRKQQPREPLVRTRMRLRTYLGGAQVLTQSNFSDSIGRILFGGLGHLYAAAA